MTEMIERRESPRRNTCFFRAFVYFDNKGTAIDCVVRDISETGAGLQFPKPQSITEFLNLHIPAKGQSFPARVRWHDSDEVGIAFHPSEKTNKASIGPDRRMDLLEAEVAVLTQAVSYLRKIADRKTQAA
jgi:hypothetical protein